MKNFFSKIIVISCVAAVLLWGIWYQCRQRVTISVIVPVYNAEKFLPRCLDSIMSQDGNFEVIAVNDGSTDKSLQVLQQYAGKYPNFTIISQKNQGVSAARNTGLNAVKNKYITFVDSDDWLEPDAFAKAIKVIKKDQPQMLMAGFYDVYDQDWVRKTGGDAALKEAPEGARFPTRKLDKLALFSPFYGKEAYSDVFYVGTGVRGQFFLGSFIAESKLSFPLGVKCSEDDIFVYRALQHNPLVSVLVDPIYNYRNRVDSLSKSQNVIADSHNTLEVLQRTPEYKAASRRAQMLMEDAMLSLAILGLSNLQRHGAPWGTGFEKAYNAYNAFSKYNKEELKSCRNLYRLQMILFEK